MPTNDLLNASQFLENPDAGLGDEKDLMRDKIDALHNFSAALLEDIGEEEGVEANLPETLNFAGIDTKIPLTKEAAAFLVGMGDGIVDTIDGVQQLLGREDVQRELAADQALMNELYNDPRYGTATRVGQVGGFVADPLGVILPVGKGKNLWDIAKVGAATGTTFAGLGYVDESQGQTRAGNALIGMVTGGVASPTLFAATRGAKGAGAWIQEKSADSLLNTYKKSVNRFVAEGATAEQATRWTLKRLGWTDEDRARFVMASGKPLGTKPTDFTREAAERNLLAMQSRPIRAWNDYVKNNPWAQGVDRAVRSVADGVKRGIVPLSTRIAKIDSDVGKNLIKMEANVHKAQHNLQQDMKPFLKLLRDAEGDPTWGRQLQADLFSGDLAGAKAIWRKLYGSERGKGRAAMREFDKMRSVLKMLYKEQKTSGYNIPELENYFPRRVRDYDGLMWFQDSELSTELRLFKQTKRRHPSTKELDAMIMRLRDPRRFERARTGSQLQRRGIEKLTQDHIQFYEPAHRALFSHINDAVTDIERAKFFRTQGVAPKDGFSIDGTDIDGETGLISELLRRGERKGKYLTGEINDLADMLRSRFTTGEQAPKEAIAAFKNMTYIATLGNFKSALTQFGDVAWSAHKNGILNTAAAWAKGLPGLFKGPGYIPKDKEFVTKAMIGLDDAMQEFADSSTTKRWLDKVLQVTRFTAMDRLGKETYINAHLTKVNKALNDPKRMVAERIRLRQKWNSVFGDETEALIDDLANKRFSDNVGVYLFDSLAEVQPIALSEMPQAYLNNPNGRVFYMLRSFTLKQLDLMRRDILDKIAMGDYKAGMYNFLSLASLFTLANGTADMAKDFMSGDEVNMEDTLTDNVWKLMGLNRYTGDKVLGGTPGQAVVDMLAPPLTVYDRLLSARSPDKLWEASPFNGLQIFDEILQTGWTRSDADRASANRAMFHDTWDRED